MLRISDNNPGGPTALCLVGSWFAFARVSSSTRNKQDQ